MSNARAIAATTATLRQLLLINVPIIDTGLADLQVTAKPLDLARKNISAAQLNLFLFETQIAAAWRSHDLPAQVRPGETGTPPLALNLHYLLTAYSRDDSDNEHIDHRALASAMGLLSDHALLGAKEITDALAGNDLGNQIERVRITWRPMGVEEMSKLWTVFQSQYRLSAAYEVGVVLIDSRRPVRAPLPVLNRGADGRGPVALADRLPTLRTIRLPRSQSAIRLGEDAVLTGDDLTATDTTAIVSGALRGAPVTLPLAAAADPGELSIRIADVTDDPAALSRWYPGYYLVALQQARPGMPTMSSNALPVALAPRITVAPLAAAVGDIALTLTCAPRIRPGQQVTLIFGDRQLKPDAIDTPANLALPTTLDFTVPEKNAAGEKVTVAGNYVVRLRVDGVDSIPVIQAGAPPLPAFDPAQTVVVA